MGANALHKDRPVVIVVGCDDVGSAIACALHGAGAAVVLVDDADPPWARRGRSYADAWYVGGATLERVDACFCGSVRSIPAVLARGDMIAATTWSFQGVASALKPVALIETRPGCGMAVARSRPGLLEGLITVGVRTTQIAGWPADVVIAGDLHADFSPPTVSGPGTAGGRRPPLMKALRIEASRAGRFRTRHEIAERVEMGDVLGALANSVVIAPGSGVLTALSARGARVAAGQTLVEIDPSGDTARCFGMTPEARAIAQRVTAAVRKASAGTQRLRSAVPGDQTAVAA